MVEPLNYKTVWSVKNTIIVCSCYWPKKLRNANKNMSFTFAWDNESLYSRLLLSWTVLLILLLLFLICPCHSGNIINQYINKQLVRLISEIHTQTHNHTYTNLSSTDGASSQIWNVLRVRPGATGPAGRLTTPPVEPRTGAQPSVHLPSFSGGKKNNIMGHGEYTHTFTSTHTQSHWLADTYCSMCKHTVRTSMDHSQLMSLWRSSNHNTHTGHTRHTLALSVKTYITVQTLRTHERERTHTRKFHFMVSKAPFSDSHQWFSICSSTDATFVESVTNKRAEKLLKSILMVRRIPNRLPNT